MATLGSTAKPSTSQLMYGLNTSNAQALLLTLPAGGPWKITRVGVWMAGVGGSVTAKLCLWTANATLVRNTGAITVGGLSFALGAAGNYEGNIGEYIVNGGTNVYVGWVRDPAGDHQFPVTGSGTHLNDTQTGSWPATMSGWTSASYQIGAYLEYEASNSLPTAPTLVSPASGARLTDLTPTLDWSFNDPDGDQQAAFQVQVDTDSAFGSPTTYSGTTAGAYTLPTQPRGVKTYWRVRSSDAEGYGPWSGSRWWQINRIPTVTKTSPLAADFPYIHNLASDLNVWTSGGAHAKPFFTWTFSDPDGDAQNGCQVKVYSASSGGTVLYDSGVKAQSTQSHLATWAGVLGTEYWWTLNVRDAYNEWSGESSRTAFKFKWSQAIYEYAVAGGVSSSGWSVTTHSAGSGQLGLLVASATGAAGAGRGPWSTSTGSVVPNAYLNVLLRLASNAPGSGMSLDDMTFNYIASAIQPERWTFGTLSTDWMLDPEERRYGSQALRMSRTSTTGERVAYPYTKNPGDDFPVTSNTEYTASAYIKTAALLASGVRLEVRPAGGGTAWDGVTLVDATKNLATNTTLDLDNNREGWQRISVRFLTGSIDTIRLCVVQDAAGSVVGDTFWVDAVQLEESSVASPWRPGMVGNPVVMDVGGIAIDASAGGIFRLRSEDGVKTVELEGIVRHLRFVPITRIVVFSSATTSTTIARTLTPALAGIPADAVMVSGTMDAWATVLNVSNYMLLYQTEAGSNDVGAAMTAGAPAVHNLTRMSFVVGCVQSGGAKVSYMVGNASSVTITYSLFITGYWTPVGP